MRADGCPELTYLSAASNQTLVCQPADQLTDLGAGFALRPASMKVTR